MSKGKVPITLVQESSTTDPVVTEVFGRLARGAVGVVNIHRTLANSPDVFAAFIGLAHALRFETEIDPVERELAILRVLELHDGDYEAGHHRRMAVSVGATEPQVAGTAVKAGALDISLYDDRQNAVLGYAEAFALNGGVDRAASDALERHLGDRQIVELTTTVAVYLGLPHLSHALDVPVDRPHAKA